MKKLTDPVTFVIDSMMEVGDGCTLSRFIDLRYYELQTISPHGTFSVEHATRDFFKNAYEHIFGITPVPQSKSEYDTNYAKWVSNCQKLLHVLPNFDQ